MTHSVYERNRVVIQCFTVLPIEEFTKKICVEYIVYLFTSVVLYQSILSQHCKSIKYYILRLTSPTHYSKMKHNTLEIYIESQPVTQIKKKKKRQHDFNIQYNDVTE